MKLMTPGPLTEGRLRINTPLYAVGYRFDDESHGLSHAMKAVDFVVRDGKGLWFVEIKDPEQSGVPRREQDRFLQDMKAGRLDMQLARKYRDSWLYMWARQEVDEFAECHYYVIIGMSSLDSALLLRRTEALRRVLPLDGTRGMWHRQIANVCQVFSIESWNERFEEFQITCS